MDSNTSPFKLVSDNRSTIILAYVGTKIRFHCKNNSFLYKQKLLLGISDLTGGNVSNLATRRLSSISSRIILIIIEFLSLKFSVKDNKTSLFNTKSVSNKIKLAVHDVI